MRQRCPHCSGETLLIYDSLSTSPAGCELCFRKKNPKKFEEIKNKQNKAWTEKVYAIAEEIKRGMKNENI